MMKPLREDWEGVGRWLESGKWQWAIDNTTKRDYQLLESSDQIDTYLNDYIPFHSWFGCDTESHAGRPYSLQVSLERGTGRLVEWSNTRLVRYLGWCLHELHLNPILHYAPSDLDMVEQMMAVRTYRDTQQEAYQLLLPQGLKSLSRRLLGRNRLSWEETVTPASKGQLTAWMSRAWKVAEGWQQVVERTHKKTGKPLKPRIISSPAEKTLLSIYGSMRNNPEYKVWDKLQERLVEYMPQLERAVGQLPVRGVAHLSMEELVSYGCSDADDTLTLGLMFEKMRREFVEKLGFQDEDVDQ